MLNFFCPLSTFCPKKNKSLSRRRIKPLQNEIRKKAHKKSGCTIKCRYAMRARVASYKVNNAVKSFSASMGLFNFQLKRAKREGKVSGHVEFRPFFSRRDAPLHAPRIHPHLQSENKKQTSK